MIALRNHQFFKFYNKIHQYFFIFASYILNMG